MWMEWGLFDDSSNRMSRTNVDGGYTVEACVVRNKSIVSLYFTDCLFSRTHEPIRIAATYIHDSKSPRGLKRTH